MAIQTGMPIPDKILNAPTLLPGLELYYTAFNRLSTCRQVGMGVGPIPWTSIAQYALMQELDQDHTEALFYHVEHMDGQFLSWSASRTKSSDGHKD